MSAPAFPSVIAAALIAFKAASGLQSARIFDGPEIDGSWAGDAVAVGHDGNVDADEIGAGTFSQEYAPIGARNKMEDGTVNCFLWTFDGTTDLTARRVRAYTLLAACEAAVRQDPSLGGVCLFAGVDGAQTKYRQTSQGAAVLIPFTITYRARV